MSNENLLDNKHESFLPHSSFPIPHSSFLQRCLELACIPAAAVEPNPNVGAVVVWEGQIIGEGFHEYFGGPHAEVNAIAAVKDRSLLKETTLYVSLEPCNHHGKTPPCTQLILDSGIRKVVIGALDPNPQMAGKSVELLRAQGVEVIVAEDQGPFLDLIAHFRCNQLLQRPFITLKWAQSTDGFLCRVDENGNPLRTFVSCAEANRYMHWLRHTHQAILVGKTTGLTDNPSLTTRLWPGRDPIRILLDSPLEVPESFHLYQGIPTIIVNLLRNDMVGNVRYFKVEDTRDLETLLQRLYKELKIGSILVEGGSVVHQSFLKAGLWDRIIRDLSPQVFGGGILAALPPSDLLPDEILGLGVDRMEVFGS